MIGKFIHFNAHGDHRGQLVALESLKDIPFEIKRIYYIYDTIRDARRGYHAHRNLEQVLICVNGSCTIFMDDGKENCEVVLDAPTKGLYLSNNIWREMYNFSKDAVLLVLASDYYQEDDYIRDYQAFMKELENGNL